MRHRIGVWAALFVWEEPKLFCWSEPASCRVSLAPPAAEENKRNKIGDSLTLILLYRRSPPHPLPPLPTFGKTNSSPFFLSYGHIPLPQFLSLGPCWEQASWSPSLHPSALSPPYSSFCESRAPETHRGGGAQDSRGPGPGAGKDLRMGKVLAGIPQESGPRGRSGSQGSQTAETILPSFLASFRACSMLIWTIQPSGGLAGCPQWSLLMPPLSMRL